MDESKKNDEQPSTRDNFGVFISGLTDTTNIIDSQFDTLGSIKKEFDRQQKSLHEAYDKLVGKPFFIDKNGTTTGSEKRILGNDAAVKQDNETEIVRHTVFEKTICLENIRYLLRKTDIKIGRLEKESGVQPGYLSRIEKKENSAQPSLDFLLKASELFHVSMDQLLSVKLWRISPSEQYILNFLDKLRKDTNQDKLHWYIDAQKELSNMIPVEHEVEDEVEDEDGSIDHPLFIDVKSLPKIVEINESVPRIVFLSKYFGIYNVINDDCYALKIDVSTLYFMDIKSIPLEKNKLPETAKEIWMYVPGSGAEFIAGDKDTEALSQIIEALSLSIKETLKHPKVSRNVKSIIDAFMTGKDRKPEDFVPF